MLMEVFELFLSILVESQWHEMKHSSQLIIAVSWQKLFKILCLCYRKLIFSQNRPKYDWSHRFILSQISVLTEFKSQHNCHASSVLEHFESMLGWPIEMSLALPAFFVFLNINEIKQPVKKLGGYTIAIITANSPGPRILTPSSPKQRKSDQQTQMFM